MKTALVNTINETVAAPASKVWEALTNPRLIKKYFFGTDAISDWQPGSPITFSGEYEGKKYKDKGTILESKPGKLLKYSYWSSMSGIEDKPENYVNISFALAESQGQTRITVTQDNIPDEKTKAHSAENWKKVLKGLKELLEKDRVEA